MVPSTYSTSPASAISFHQSSVRSTTWLQTYLERCTHWKGRGRLVFASLYMPPRLRAMGWLPTCPHRKTRLSRRNIRTRSANSRARKRSYTGGMYLGGGTEWYAFDRLTSPSPRRQDTQI